MARIQTEEERRAEDYRRDQKRRYTVLREREKRLRGNKAAAADLFDRWAWLLDPPPPALDHPDPDEPLV